MKQYCLSKNFRRKQCNSNCYLGSWGVQNAGEGVVYLLGLYIMIYDKFPHYVSKRIKFTPFDPASQILKVYTEEIIRKSEKEGHVVSKA